MLQSCSNVAPSLFNSLRNIFRRSVRDLRNLLAGGRIPDLGLPWRFEHDGDSALAQEAYSDALDILGAHKGRRWSLRSERGGRGRTAEGLRGGRSSVRREGRGVVAMSLGILNRVCKAN